MANENDKSAITVEDTPEKTDAGNPPEPLLPARAASMEIALATANVDVSKFSIALGGHQLAETKAFLTATDPLRQFYEGSSYARMDDEIRRFEELSGISQMQNHLRSIGNQSAQLSEHLKFIEGKSGFAQLSEHIGLMEQNSIAKMLTASLDTTGELARAAIGPTWELRALGLLDPTGRDHVDHIRKAIEDMESKFRIPNIDEMFKLTTIAAGNEISSIAHRWAQDTSVITRAIEGMSAPWLDVENQIRSITGMAEMQGLGLALQAAQGFESRLSETLRGQLGDWRDPITWRSDILDDLRVRSDFYVDLGFNSRLTDFPLPAFEQGLDRSGLRRERPPLIGAYGPPLPLDLEDDEDGLGRTNTAHDWLQRLERLVRRFIDEKMTSVYGADWPRHRLPTGFRDRWEEKKKKAMDAGADDLPLICYADFTDYTQVICKTDNWREVFVHFFRRPEDIRESFQRLHPIRLDTAHARLISQDDELLLYVEVRRLWSAIRSSRN